MKKFWLSALAMLLALVMSTCALAEGEVYSDTVDQEVSEVEEFSLGEEPVAGAEIVPEESVDEPEVSELPEVERGLEMEGREDPNARAFYQFVLAVTKNNGTITLAVGDQMQLIPDFATSLGLTVTQWKSGKTKVAVVAPNGIVTAIAEGKAKITVTSSNKKIKATLTVQVIDPFKPTGVAILNGATTTMYLGQSLQLFAALIPETAQSALTWKSSKTKVAVVDPNGIVTAVGDGKAKITVTTRNKKKATITIVVDGAIRDPSIRYRALLVGESHFPMGYESDLPGTIIDVNNMTNMLRSVKGPMGNGWEIYPGIDLSYDEIYDAIQNIFYDATENDVSLFFFSGHGMDSVTYEDAWYDDDWYWAGCLDTYPGGDYGLLPLHDLAYWFSQIPGKVIVMIDSCGSGSAVYGGRGYDPKTFDQQVIDAFSSVDCGVMAPFDEDVGAFVMENKFYVLTAAAEGEESWENSKNGGYFAQWVVGGVKTKGRMPADYNRDKFVTLDELYQFTAQKGLAQRWPYTQHIQVYPYGSSMQLFFRK